MRSKNGPHDRRAASIEEPATFRDVRADWLAQAYRLARRNNSGLPENDKQRRFLSKRDVVCECRLKSQGAT
jgi:hypothetical protein